MQPTLPTPLLSQLSNVLAANLGLNFPAERWGDLERGISAAAPDFGLPDARACAHRLLSAPLTHQEIEILASRLTIGETYFFRDPRSYEVLEQHILLPLLREREKSEHRLRIWSAGCSTGEEAYSIAMLIDQLIPKANDWNISILATDINPDVLRKASKGEYGEWSFRGTPAWVRDRHFHRRAAGRFVLDERIRKRVSFSFLNLADDIYPSLTNNTNAMDVILCRNVLMYFTPERARQVIEHLWHALVDGGWLIVSPAETSSALFSNFTTVEFSGAILYRKDASAKRPRYESHLPPPAEDYLQPSWAWANERIPAVERAAPEPMPAASSTAETRSGSAASQPEQDQFIGAARDCANQGRLDEAAEWCRKAIAADKINPAHHYLLSAIQLEQGQSDEAAQSLARALYLDPDFALAHYALANLRQSQGRLRESQRHFDNAMAALRTHPADEILPESGGLTAGRLSEIIASLRSSMPQLAARL